MEEQNKATSSGLFREKSLEAIESPESLNDYLRVTSPQVWLVLAAVMLTAYETASLPDQKPHWIMTLFLEHPGKVFTKQQLYECGWGEEYIVADNNIMVCISKLRSKLSEDPSEYIKTMRGLGYRLV